MKLAAFMKSVLKRTGEFFQNTEKKKLILLVSLATVVIVAGIVGAILLNQVKYTVLYSGLDPSEAGTIKTMLDTKGVVSKVQGTNTILVPEEKADELRIQLASEGYPSTGLNYDIFSNSSALGSTDLERRTYLQYQLQENMRTAISSFFDKVQESIVIVNLASSSSFVLSDDASAASVSVMLKLKKGETLTNTEAKTIGEFVITCVPELKPENVSIVDSQMNYYDILSDDEDDAEYSVSQQQLTEQMKETLADQALRVIEPAMGAGNVAVSVNLSLDFDKETVNKVEFSPPVAGDSAGLARSSEELYDLVGGASGASGSAGTDTNGVGTPAYVSEEDPSQDVYTSISKTYNYELNEIQTQLEKALGSVQNLSVAVLINSKVEGMEGYVDTVKNLVAKSIGVKPDYISVELMPFVDSNSVEDAFRETQKTLQQANTNKLITTILTIAGLLAAVIVIARIFIKKPTRDEEETEALGGGQIVGLTAGEAGLLHAAETYDLSELILKRSTEADKIEELMDRYPETVAQILRTWIAEDN